MYNIYIILYDILNILYYIIYYIIYNISLNGMLLILSLLENEPPTTIKLHNEYINKN